MRDFRDAKTMAHTLRDALAEKSFTISHSESLELVSTMLGVSDWNTLSALLLAERQGAKPAQAGNLEGTASYPAIPIRDFVPFPSSTFPLYVGREKTKNALDHAFERHREIVLAVQKDSTVDEPGSNDVCEVGVLATLLDVERMPDGLMHEGQPVPNGSMKILVHAHRRVLIRSFIGDAGAYQAEISGAGEETIPDAPDLIQKAVERFESYTAANKIPVPRMWPALGQSRNVSRVADVISAYMPLSIDEKQRLLATSDPLARLKKVTDLMDGKPQLAL